MNNKLRGAVRSATFLSAAALGAFAANVAAQETETPESSAPTGETIEEVVATGRQRSVATDVVQERIEQEVVADFLGIDQISRVGDSTVSAALRRLPGVTLVQGKFIYVRGLGERYSSTTLNGAYVPSPDLTRNVIPLDLFPTSILDSLAVSKGFSPDLPAAFGGGSVDIRTSGIPEAPFLQFEIGSGIHSDSSGSGLGYPGGHDFGADDGSRAFSSELAAQLARFQGNLSPANILETLNQDGNPHTIEEANLINRQIATNLNRNVDLRNESISPDLKLSGSGGNTWYFGDGDAWGLGVLGLVDYGTETRNKDRSERGATAQTKDIVVSNTQRTVDQIDLTTALTTGIKWYEDHAIEALYLFLRNTEDEASIRISNNTNVQPGSGLQLRNLSTRFEQRELTVQQFRGEHQLGYDTLKLLEDRIDLSMVEDLRFSWYYSDSEANTAIPNETAITAQDVVDVATGEVLSTTIRPTSSAGDFRFTDLIDDVRSSGWELELPWQLGERTELSVAVGQDSYSKARRYLQTQLGLGTTTGGTEGVRTGPPSQVFADANILDPDNGYFLNLGGLGTESYLASERVDATFGKFDVTWDERWRVSGGARFEAYKQLSLPIDQYDFSGNKVPLSPQQIANAVSSSDEYYPALAVTYMAQDFWAEDFQLRFNYSQTATRPDLREVADSVFIDPLTEIRLQGNPNLLPSELNNFDLRAEWFFMSGDSFSATLFYKDIDQPIETVEGAGSEDNVLLTFINAESAEVLGVELETYVSLGHLQDMLGDWTDAFFFSGNLTLADSEITIGQGSGFNATNNTRPLTQSSDYALNLQLGFDSFDAMHSASLAFNTFGERVFFAGRGGAPDAYEQPFNSVDFTYSWYPTDLLTIKLKAQNLLDEKAEIERGGIITRTQNVGTAVGLSAKLKF